MCSDGPFRIAALTDEADVKAASYYIRTMEKIHEKGSGHPGLRATSLFNIVIRFLVLHFSVHGLR